MVIIPPYLSEGDTIGIVCPGGYMPAEKAQTCIQVLMQWGFEVKIGSTVGGRFNYFSGTDEQRLEDLQQMLDDDSVKAVLCARGGYGTGRIIDRLNFKKFCFLIFSAGLKSPHFTLLWLQPLTRVNMKMSTFSH